MLRSEAFLIAHYAAIISSVLDVLCTKRGKYLQEAGIGCATTMQKCETDPSKQAWNSCILFQTTKLD